MDDGPGRRLTRAELVRRAAAAGGESAGSGIERGSVVKLYCWQGYDDEYALETFKSANDVTVQPSYIGGDQEVLGLSDSLCRQGLT